MIYRRITTTRGRIEIVLGQNLSGAHFDADTAATLSKESPFTEFMVTKGRRVNRDALAKYLRGMRRELREFVRETDA